MGSCQSYEVEPCHIQRPWIQELRARGRRPRERERAPRGRGPSWIGASPPGNPRVTAQSRRRLPLSLTAPDALLLIEPRLEHQHGPKLVLVVPPALHVLPQRSANWCGIEEAFALEPVLG